MIVAVIILSIGLIGSVLFNILLSSSKNFYISQINKIQKENKELKLGNEKLGNLVYQQESKINTYEKTIRSVEHQKKESDSPQIEKLKKENERLALQVTELEKTVLLSSESDDKVRQLETTIEDQKQRISSLLGQIGRKEEEKNNVNQRCEDASRKIEEIQRVLEQLKIQNATHQTQLISTQKQNVDLNANINLLLTSKAELEKKNKQLLEQVHSIGSSHESLLNQVSQLKRENKELQSSCNNYRIQIAQKEERISELEKNVDELTGSSKITDKPEISQNPSATYVPNKLDFPTDSDVIQFKDGEFKDTLKRISDVFAMREYLKKTSHEKSQRYLKQVEAYAEELEELEDAFIRLDEDEEEISSECISKFSKVFNEYMAENIIEPVYKAKEEEKFYTEILELIIEYVSRCGIYTKNVTVGSKFENINYMEVITEDTADSAKHKIISRILRLPFYAKYTSETGKVKEKLLSKGCCVVLKAK